MKSGTSSIRASVYSITRGSSHALVSFFNALEAAVIEGSGIDSRELRRLVWSVCLGLHPTCVSSPSLEWKIDARKSMHELSEAFQIELDIKRSLNFLDIHDP